MTVCPSHSLTVTIVSQIHYLRLTTAILHHEKSRKYLLSNVLYPSVALMSVSLLALSTVPPYLLLSGSIYI